MRCLLAAVLLVMPACHLYFGDERADPDDDPPIVPIDAPWRPIDAPPADAPWPQIDAPPGASAELAYCGSDGTLYRTGPIAGAPDLVPENVYAAGVPFGTCPTGSCQDDSTFAVCSDGGCSNASAELCRAPLDCPESGQSCTGDATITCSEQVACAVSAAVSSCTCRGGSYVCEPACTGQVCGADAVGALLRGRWVGTVDPPPFSDPYTGQLGFGADHSYLSNRTDGVLFYYGMDGTSRVHRWRPIGVGPTGGVATVDIYFGTHSIRTALLTDVRRENGRLRFTFWDSWLDCSRPFNFDLGQVQ